ncbi:hypothetical protein [Tengunoibacter tsumagoiensis]|uniref:Uncharacterized protein n=1 Tax=Tengunoibacter tsumagoiensis TaxID=2014871 RepID=A0A401ZYV1_9CHLR|nr:hypothetical protein [Tengunoibacter tsumagoiensis]GCE12020.1 hypothetical protein KTT_18790 [Tengunoibacter tsumagoiensis]
MTKLIGIQESDVLIEAKFVKDSFVYYIKCNPIAETEKYYYFGLRSILWLSLDGIFSEIESMYPKVGKEPLCSFDSQVQKEEGLPVLEMIPTSYINYVQETENGFIIYVERDRKINHVVIYKTIEFLFCDNDLVAIEAKEAAFVPH